MQVLQQLSAWLTAVFLHSHARLQTPSYVLCRMDARAHDVHHSQVADARDGTSASCPVCSLLSRLVGVLALAQSPLPQDSFHAPQQFLPQVIPQWVSDWERGQTKPASERQNESLNS